MADRPIDEVVERYLRQRGAHDMPPTLADDVVRVAEASPQEPANRFWPLLPQTALATAAAVAIVAITVIWQALTPPVGDDPPAPPPPSAAATDEAPPEATSTPADIDAEAGWHAITTTERVDIRYEQRADAPVITALAEGERVYILEGPIGADDRLWYRLQHPGHRYVPGFGWASFENQAEADAALEPFEPRCPSPPIDMELFEDMTAMERLGCFGDEPITIGPIFVLPGEAGSEEPTGDPAWLVGPAPWELYTSFNWPNATTQGSLSGRIEPGADLELTGETWMEIVGRFDHPAASGCTRQLPEPSYTESMELTELWCRQQFVILEAVAVPALPEE